MHCKKTFATFLCQNSGTILIITYVFCYQSNFLTFAGEHWLAIKSKKTMEARPCHFKCGKMCLTRQQTAGCHQNPGSN